MPSAIHEFLDPTNADAKNIWPILLPLYQQLLNARYDLEQSYPRQSRLCHRMAAALREQLIDAELGLLDAHPEARVLRAQIARAV